ncbi:crotonobetaine/carnitine-CoA ligase [Breoghania corrubedonensis]|uniref:Crotonobetaine/carnitine-CoA ligase n=1 Tax=Breoghania corrubedonensis TaxID=665038 RepID=A0A2T5UYN6_9HYPH|nr:ATP-dependent acyl-CoA ligase [Breoghania corrubedonensis]PTW56615.1 crotonobetaine/carnitine-CoA ligase [Breoghania corrubedonensis]
MPPFDFTAAFAPADRTLPRLMSLQAARFGAREFVAFDETSWTYAEALDVAARWAGTLRAAGVTPGDRVAILSSNRPEMLALVFGCAWAGVIAVPINVASRGVQLQHILSNSGARLLAIESDLLPALETLDFATLAVDRLWIIGGGAPTRIAFAEPLPAPGEAIEPAPSRPGDTAAIVYTSGTTGPSKGVCCPHANLVWWGANTVDLLGLRDGERLYTTLPLFHVNAFNTVYQALITGSTVLIGKRFSVSGLWPAVHANGATATYLLGAMVPMLLSKPETPLDRAHKVRIALGPGVPAQFHETFRERFGFGLVEGYGSTETNFVIGARLGEATAGTMGRIRPGFSARVVDSEDNEVAAGEAGELILRADEPFAFSTGYFGMADKTVEAWRNLWFHTGDRVIRDADGSFRFVDRLKDAIRRRGENISSFEVEQVVQSHPAVEAVAVFPVKSDLAEDEVMAAIALRPGEVLAEADLIEFCRPRLPYFAVPRYLEFVKTLPMTENGKLQKFKLRERGVTERTWDREAHGISVR